MIRMQTTGGRRPLDACREGFTLIELLVAMGILTIIVLITSRLFQQATVVWNVGTQRAEMNMKGRALADFMAQELSMAIPSADFDIQDESATFHMLGDADGTNRALRKVEYKLTGTDIERNGEAMSDGVSKLEFEPIGDLSTNSLPLGVSVRVTVASETETRYFESRACFVHRDRNRLD